MQHLIDKYHNLQGQKVSREYLENFGIELFDALPLDDPKIIQAWNNVYKVLSNYPEAKNFEFENISPLTGLNGIINGEIDTEKYPLSIVKKDYPLNSVVKIKKSYDKKQPEGKVVDHGYIDRVRVVEYPFHILVEFKNGKEWIKPYAVDVIESSKKEEKPKEKKGLKQPSEIEPLVLENYVTEVLKTKKFKGKVSVRQGVILYNKLASEPNEVKKLTYVRDILALDRKSSLYKKVETDDDVTSYIKISLTDLGKEFIEAVTDKVFEYLFEDKKTKGLKASVETLDYETVYLDLKTEPDPEPQNEVSAEREITPEPTPEKAQLFVENKPVEQTEDKNKTEEPTEVLHLKPKTNKKLPKGFTRANEKIDLDALPGLFVLPGEIGKWLQKQQRYRLMILVHGESGAGKSELVKQLSNSFLDAGFTGGFFDLEQGGLISKDTQESIARNIPEQNKANIAFTDEAEQGLESVKAVADEFDFVVVDSWQKLKEPMTRLDELRIEHPNTIWIIITQETQDGKAKGGSQTVFDPPVRLKSYKVDNDFINNYTEIMKNRGNQNTVGTRYNMYKKQVITEETEPEPKEEPKPYVSSSGGGIVYS